MRYTVCLLIGLTHVAAVVSAGEPVGITLNTGGHTAEITDIAFTPDSRRLVSVSRDKTIRIWNITTGTTEQVIRGQIDEDRTGEIYAVALSPDGRWLAIGGCMPNEPGTGGCLPEDPTRGGHHIRLHDLKSGAIERLLEGHAGEVLALTFGPESKRLVSGDSSGTVIGWDVQRGTELFRDPKPPDYFDETDPSPLRTRKRPAVDTVALLNSKGGPYVVLPGIVTWARVLRISDGKTVIATKGRRRDEAVQAIAVTPDGKRIATLDDDRSIRISEAETGRLEREITPEQTPGDVGYALLPEGRDFAFLPDGKQLLTDEGDIYDVSTDGRGSKKGRVLKHESKSFMGNAAISRDGEYVALTEVWSDSIVVWKREEAAYEQFRSLKGSGANIWSVGFAKDGSFFAWGRNQERPEEPSNYGDLEFRFQFPARGKPFESPDRLSSSDRSKIAGASLRAGEYRLRFNRRSPKRLLVIRSGNPTAKLDWSKKKAQHRVFSFHSSGKRVVSGGSNGTLIGYDARDGQELVRYAGHTGSINGIATLAGRDRGLLLSGSTDQTLKFWNLTTGELLATFVHIADDDWVMWTEQGYYDASPKLDERRVGYHINCGPDKTADFVPAIRLKTYFNRADIIALALEKGSATEALETASIQEDFRTLEAALSKLQLSVCATDRSASVRGSPDHPQHSKTITRRPRGSRLTAQGPRH